MLLKAMETQHNIHLRTLFSPFLTYVSTAPILFFVSLLGHYQQQGKKGDGFRDDDDVDDDDQHSSIPFQS